MTYTVHQTEIFPTTYRSIAVTIPSILGQCMNILLPWILELRKTNPALPFIIVSILPFLTAPIYLCLPETHNKSLPQTIEEAELFGNDQKFWSYNINSKKLNTKMIKYLVFHLK